MRNKIKSIFSKYMIYEITQTKGVTIMAIIAIVYFYFNKRVIATALPLSTLGFKIFDFFGLMPSELSANANIGAALDVDILNDPTLVLIIGFALGSIVTALLRKKYRVTGVGSFKHIFSFIIGGFCVGFGVQGIQGANIGEVFGAVSMLSLSGWIAIPFIVIGIYLAKPLYNKLKRK